MARGPEAAKAGCRCERAEEDATRQARCQEVRAARAPRHHEVDMERHPDPETLHLRNRTYTEHHSILMIVIISNLCAVADFISVVTGQK